MVVFYTGFYWIGLAMILACLALILAGNTESLYRFEHTRFPLSWGFAVAAMLAFLAAELCHPVDSLASETEDEDAELVSNWDAVEV
jgi:uncharacterized membrane protein YoaT (DUF817 family)